MDKAELMAMTSVIEANKALDCVTMMREAFFRCSTKGNNRCDLGMRRKLQQFLDHIGHKAKHRRGIVARAMGSKQQEAKSDIRLTITPMGALLNAHVTKVLAHPFCT